MSKEENKKPLNFEMYLDRKEETPKFVYFDESQEKYFERISRDIYKYNSSIHKLSSHFTTINTRAKEIFRSFSEMRLIIENMYKNHNSLVIGESDKLEIDGLSCEIENIEKEFLDFMNLLKKGNSDAKKISIMMSNKLTELKDQ